MAERERPANWEDWKWLHRWPRLTSIEWALEWLVYWCRGLAIFEVLEFVGRASVLVAAVLWVFEAGDREKTRLNEIKQKHYRAWELINSARGSTGDGGRRDALQDLWADNVNLAAAPLAKAYLVGVKLPNAILTGAGLSTAVLAGADLSRANLTQADLSGADLSLANLSRANLNEVNLRGANLSWTNLTQAYLRNANLTDANLENAKFCETTMPTGTLNNRECQPEPAPPPPSETSPAPG